MRPTDDAQTTPRRALRATLVLAIRWLIMLSGALLFVGLAFSFRGPPVSHLDMAVARQIAELRPSWLTEGAYLITHLGNGPVLAGVAAVVSIGLFFLRQRAPALYVALSAVGAGGLNAALKLLFARQRPDELWQFASTSGYSFPSGHAMAGASVYVAIAVVLTLRFEKLKHVAIVVCTLVVLALGLSRMVLGVHFATDVIAGWALGVSWPLWLRPLLVTPATPATSSDRPLIVDDPN